MKRSVKYPQFLAKLQGGVFFLETKPTAKLLLARLSTT